MKLEAISPLGNVFGDEADILDISSNVRERSDIGAVLCSTIGLGEDYLERLENTLACSVPTAHGAIKTKGSKRAIWLSPRSWIVLTAPDEESALVAAVTAAFPDREVLASRFTDALGWFSIKGPEAENLLRQGSFLGFRPSGVLVGYAKRTLVAGIPAVILRETETSWIIGVERSRAQYFVNWLAGLTQSFRETR